MAIVYPSLYGGAPPVSTRIIPLKEGSPHFLRSVCPLPGCQRSSSTGSSPLVNIPAGYWLILCSCLLTVQYVHQHLTADVFLMSFPFCHSLSGAGHPDRDRNPIPELSDARFWSRASSYISFICNYAATGLPMSPSIFCPS